MIGQILEAAMLTCFGLSWPLNAYKNFKAGTAAGTSWQFILLITVGYLAGIAAKICSDTINWVLIVYLINLVFLAANWAVYFRNRRLDAQRLEKRTESDFTPSVETVIIATDGSRASLDALSFATSTMDLSRSKRVEVISVMQTSSSADKEKAGKATAAAKAILEKSDVRAIETVREGDPATAIVNAANRTDANLVVIGSRGLSGLKEKLLGSVSREVAEHTSCPVLIVK